MGRGTSARAPDDFRRAHLPRGFHRPAPRPRATVQQGERRSGWPGHVGLSASTQRSRVTASPPVERTRVPSMADETPQTSPAPTTPAETSPLAAAPPAAPSRTPCHRPVPPKDDLVTTRHTLKVGRRTAALHRHRRTHRPARGGLRGRRLQGAQGQSRAQRHLLRPRRARRHPSPGHLRLQRRPGVELGLAAPRAARPATGRLRRRRRPHAPALRPRRQHREPARGLRPRLHRPRLDRLLPGGRGRQAQGLPRLQGRHRERR